MNDDFFQDLFPRSGEAYARGSDPGTAHSAAEHIRGERANRLEHKILRALHQYPNGLTNHEIVQVTGLTWNTASPRLAPLVRKGYVIDSGYTRKGPTNRPCIIWRAVKRV